MNGSSGIGQLLKGIVMGIVLILAIIGSMSLLDKNKPNEISNTTSEFSNTNNNATPNTSSVEIKAPEISITPQIKKEELKNSHTASAIGTQEFKPILEGEMTVAEKKAEQTKRQALAIKYGILKLRTINPDNKSSLPANYVVYDDKDTKVAESNNSKSASYRLPVGSYKVITTLVEANNDTTRKAEPIQSTKIITVSANKLSNEIFEMEPAPIIGVLQVSAINAKNNSPVKARFIIQKENGEQIAIRNNVTNSLFKLKAGSYKVIAKNGNNSDFRTVVVEPGESANEIFKLQEAFLLGKAFVRVVDINSNTPTQANIEIFDSKGKNVQTLKSVSQTEIALSAGNYIIKVTGSKGSTTKQVTINAGQQANQLFRIDNPATTESIQITDNVKISPVQNDGNKTEAASNELKKPTSTEGYIKLFAKNAGNQKPIKSNFYVQTPNGINIAKKIYANSAEFKLKPGKYKITVRSKNRNNIVRNIQVLSDQSITEVFSLQSNIPSTAQNKTQQVSTASNRNNKKIIPNGFLNITMRPAKKAHFIISKINGKKVVELTSVASGNFKLDTGTYTVTAILNSQRQQKNIQVYESKKSNLVFNANTFLRHRVVKKTVPKGILKSRIIDGNGRPLRGNLSVLNMRGEIVASVNNATFGEFELPAAPYTISVNFRGLSGSERVAVSTGKTTLQTFTISPNYNTSNAAKNKQTQDILRDKVEEELHRLF